MSSPVEPASLTDQFHAVAELVILNGWAIKAKLEAARAELVKHGRQVVLNDQRAIGRYLVEIHLLTSEQAAELDTILQQQTSFTNYHLLKKLGAGGMGTVFLAKQAGTDQILAVKTMMARLKEDRDFVGRFHRESNVLAGLTHPHIAKVIESGDSGNTCYMAMEYVEGPSLASLLKDHKVLPERYVLHIARQVAEGLAYVYAEAELVHRDIKPENILISRNPTLPDPFPMEDDAKLIDFGLVKPMDDDQHLTQTGMTIGTPLYMSPEQIRGEHIDCRSDLYGLGATMYHLLTGTTPFTGTSPGAIMSAHLTQPVPDPAQRVPGLNAKTRELVMMAMAKHRDQRFLTFDAFIKAISGALTDLGERAGTAPRLLRKPLVLKGPTRKPTPSQVGLPVEGASAATPIRDATVNAATERIVNKFKLRNESTGTSSQDTSRAVLAPALSNHLKSVESNQMKAIEANPVRGVESNQRTAVPSDVVKAGQTDQMRGIQSDQKKAVDSSHLKAVESAPNALDLPTDPVPRSSIRSKVFDEDPTDAVGTGMVPWLVLVAAIVALGLWFLL